jgi:acyl-CoA synthetase (AMP-forming)/AMP-acid ligase II/acyl carrier protein
MVKIKFTTIYEIVLQQARNSPEATAILSPGRQSLSYSRLFEQVHNCLGQLNTAGIGRGDTVAIVLPNGPEMAVAFLATACAATSAPLNPNYRLAEFDFYLSDLQACALIVQAGIESPAIEAAKTRSIPIFELQPLMDEPAGRFNFHTSELVRPILPGPADCDDVALVLHTSGTTSRPKMVPLTQINLCTSALNIRDWLKLTSTDRCANIMPLFHIHGLVAAVLATLSSGGSLVCTPGFNSVQFFGWLDEFKPTWYTAVPTMHQSILQRASANQAIIERTPLRFIRSSSSSLPPQVMAELEQTFHAPVIESYGMTEAAHQMASNPLPPLTRKPGSVGLPAGPQVAIMAEENSALLPVGMKGEIVIRGANVTQGYTNNPEANKKAFTDGWFRTGDQGYIDNQGYLYITGRLKEIINRGGEKISPREIDEVLLDHPAVTQVVAFAMPDSILGEQVAAAVVLNDPKVKELELKQYAASRLIYFKVPHRIIILDEIPKGPTGKLQRIGLAEKLGLIPTVVKPELMDQQPIVSPRTYTEKRLAIIWDQLLGIEPLSVHQPFTELGGDSVLAIQLAMKIQDEFLVELTLIDLSDTATIEAQAELLDRLVSRQKLQK